MLRPAGLPGHFGLSRSNENAGRRDMHKAYQGPSLTLSSAVAFAQAAADALG
jgi:hypothetical protein